MLQSIKQQNLVKLPVKDIVVLLWQGAKISLGGQCPLCPPSKMPMVMRND